MSDLYGAEERATGDPQLMSLMQQQFLLEQHQEFEMRQAQRFQGTTPGGMAGFKQFLVGAAILLALGLLFKFLL